MCSLVVGLLLLLSLTVESAFAADSLTVVVSGSYRGRLDGCHCPYGSKGGIAPRAALMKRLFPTGFPLGLDCGGYLDLDPEGGQSRSLCSLIGLRQQGLEVIFAGARDLFYGENYLKRTADSAGVVLVCANIVREPGGESLFDHWRVVERDGWCIAVTGVAEYLEGQRFPGVECWRVVPPDSTVGELRRTQPPDADLVVLLTEMNEKSLQAFLPEFPEAELVFTSNRLIKQPSPFWVGSSLVIHPQPDGGFIDVVKIPPGWSGKDSIVFESHILKADTPPDAATLKWMRKCLGWD